MRGNVEVWSVDIFGASEGNFISFDTHSAAATSVLGTEAARERSFFQHVSIVDAVTFGRFGSNSFISANRPAQLLVERRISPYLRSYARPLSSQRSLKNCCGDSVSAVVGLMPLRVKATLRVGSLLDREDNGER